jgi:transposase
MTRLLYKVPGIGKIIASVIAASVPDPSVFKSGRDFTAWLGLTPRQNSSGGKQALGAITLSRGTDTSGNCSCWGRPRC